MKRVYAIDTLHIASTTDNKNLYVVGTIIEKPMFSMVLEFYNSCLLCKQHENEDFGLKNNTMTKQISYNYFTYFQKYDIIYLSE